MVSSAPLARVPLAKPVAQVAQLVEQRTENPRVGGSIPSLGTTFHPLVVYATHFVVVATPLSNDYFDLTDDPIFTGTGSIIKADHVRDLRARVR